MPDCTTLFILAEFSVATGLVGLANSNTAPDLINAYGSYVPPDTLLGVKVFFNSIAAADVAAEFAK